MKIQIKHLFGVCETQPPGLDGPGRTRELSIRLNLISHARKDMKLQGFLVGRAPALGAQRSCSAGAEAARLNGGAPYGEHQESSQARGTPGTVSPPLASPPPGPQTLTLACRPTSAHSPPVLAPSWHQPVLFLLPSQPLVFSFFLSRLGTREVVVDLPQLWAPDVVVIRGKHHTHLADLGTWTSDKRTRHEARGTVPVGTIHEKGERQVKIHSEPLARPARARPEVTPSLGRGRNTRRLHWRLPPTALDAPAGSAPSGNIHLDRSRLRV